MCLLTFLPPDVMADVTALRNGAEINNDGHGFAIVVADRILVRRGMHAEAMIDAFVTARRRHPAGPALFHSRWTTHGSTNLDNCHPFMVGDDPRTMVAHNGVLPADVQPGEGDPRSDTRIAAEEFLPRMGSLHLRRNRLRVERWMTSANKMVVLSIDRRFRQPAYILNEKAGIWDGGIWYSNDSYQVPAGGPDGRWPWRGWARAARDSCWCPECGALTYPGDGECRFCGWCFDCGEMPHRCLCYIPQPAHAPLSRSQLPG